jgi:hypothetical protein
MCLFLHNIVSLGARPSPFFLRVYIAHAQNIDAEKGESHFRSPTFPAELKAEECFRSSGREIFADSKSAAEINEEVGSPFCARGDKFCA